MKSGSRATTLLVTGVCLAGLAAAVTSFRPRPVPSPAGVAGAAEGQAYHAAARDGDFITDPFCAGCHRTPPHGRSSHRAMLNHHVTRLHCLVCHGRGFLSQSDIRREGEMLRVAPGGSSPDLQREREWREAALRQGPCFPAGPGCMDCHRSGGVLDLRGLGYEPQRASRLEEIEGHLMRSSLDRWYFPSLP